MILSAVQLRDQNETCQFDSTQFGPVQAVGHETGLCIRLAFLASALLWYANLSSMAEPFEACAE